MTFAPLPCWDQLGVKILAQDPHDFPEHTKRSKALPCHASSEAQWKAYKGFLKELVALYETVSSRFRRGLASLEEFPAFCYPPRLPFRRESPASPFQRRRRVRRVTPARSRSSSDGCGLAASRDEGCRRSGIFTGANVSNIALA